jgi:hypothetical protein
MLDDLKSINDFWKTEFDPRELVILVTWYGNRFCKTPNSRKLTA